MKLKPITTDTLGIALLLIFWTIGMTLFISEILHTLFNITLL